MFNSIKPFIFKYTPEILLGVGLAGVVGTVIGTTIGTAKACKAVNERKKELNTDKLTKKETFKTTYKYYIVPAITLAGATACLVCGNRVSSKRQIALAAAYSLSEASLQATQDKIKEIVGDKKATQIKDSIAKDTVATTPQTQTVLVGDGDLLFYEPITGRYFKTNPTKIQLAQIKLNKEGQNSYSGMVTLNEWFYELGLDTVEFGDERGWNVLDRLLDVSVSYVPHGPEETPCGHINYNSRPISI